MNSDLSVYKLTLQGMFYTTVDFKVQYVDLRPRRVSSKLINTIEYQQYIFNTRITDVESGNESNWCDLNPTSRLLLCIDKMIYNKEKENLASLKCDDLSRKLIFS